MLMDPHPSRQQHAVAKLNFFYFFSFSSEALNLFDSDQLQQNNGIIPSKLNKKLLVAFLQLSDYFDTIRYSFLNYRWPLFVYFHLFKQTLQFYNKIMWKCPSSLRCKDSNPQTSKHKSTPITTRPGLPPIYCHFWVCVIR